MKTHRKIFLVTLFSFLAFGMSAQESRKNKWPVSKAVQSVSNRAEYTPTYVASVGQPSFVVSKDVQRKSNKIVREKKEGNMISSGYPGWTISKGVHGTKKVIRKSDYKKEQGKSDIIVRQF